MDDKHPIDKLFRDTLSDPKIPFDEKEWEMLSQKMTPRKRGKAALLIWLGSGAAAAAVLAAIMLFGDGGARLDDATYATGDVAKGPQNEVRQRDSTTTPDNGEIRAGAAPIADRDGATVAPVKTAVSPTSGQVIAVSPGTKRRNLAPVARTHALSTAQVPHVTATVRVPRASMQGPNPEGSGKWAPDNGYQPRWALSILAAPDLSGTRLASGKLSGNIGIMATYRLSSRLSISGGAIYAKKLYQTDFTNYRPAAETTNPAYTPSFVDATCNVLDIPVNLNFDFAQSRRATWFVSAGISSYLMLKEAYDYTYAPHEYGYPKQVTLHNENRHILGIGNIAVGYRHQLSPMLGITVQPFVKVPFTGIGNGNLRLHSSGVAISADINLMRQMKRH